MVLVFLLCVVRRLICQRCWLLGLSGCLTFAHADLRCVRPSPCVVWCCWLHALVCVSVLCSVYAAVGSCASGPLPRLLPSSISPCLCGLLVQCAGLSFRPPHKHVSKPRTCALLQRQLFGRPWFKGVAFACTFPLQPYYHPCCMLCSTGTGISPRCQPQDPHIWAPRCNMFPSCSTAAMCVGVFVCACAHPTHTSNARPC